MITRRTHGGLRRTVWTGIALAVLVLVSAPSTTHATAKLWLYPDSDDPRAGGHVVESGVFTLIVANVGGGGNDDNTARDVQLVVAVSDVTLLTTVSLQVPAEIVVADGASFTFGIPTLPCGDATMPPHGVYPTDFTLVPLGDIAEGQEVTVPIEVLGDPGLEVHFDAMAYGMKQAGRSEKCYSVVNPSGHDVTAVLVAEPEIDCPALTISKSTTTTGVDLYESIDYTIEVTNTGDCGLEDVVITEDIPTVNDGAGGEVPAFSVTATSPTPSIEAPDLLTWLVDGVLGPADQVIVSLTATFDRIEADGTEVVNTACVTAAGVAEPVCSSVEVAVGEEPKDEGAGSAGFWCNRIRLAIEGKPGATFTIAELEALLALVDAQSEIFPLEPAEATTIELAQAWLCNPRGAPPDERLIRQLLALRLNVVAERIDPAVPLGDLCPGDEQLPDDVDPAMTVDQVLSGAEAALLAAAERATLLMWMEIVDFVNNASMADGDGCQEAQRMRVQVRRGARHRRR